MIDKSSFRKKAKKSMRKIVEYAKSCENLGEVKKKMKINRKKFKILLDKFRKVGINPITRTE